MPNIAGVLRQEIGRLARREIRSALQPLAKSVRAQRTVLRALKSAIDEQARRLAALEQRPAGAAAPAEAPARDTSPARFSAKGLRSHRERLGLSAADAGKLLAVSGQTVYKWERGLARPRARQMPAIVAFRALGRRAALQQLEAGAAPSGK